jgi:hypothetical protein
MIAFKFKTTDGHEVEFGTFHGNPNLPPGQMAPAMNYSWIKVPNEPWVKVNARSQIQTRNAIETNTLEDLKFFINTGMI